MLKKYLPVILSTIILSIPLLASPVSAMQSFDTRSFGMGGIGVSSAKPLTAVLHNPALISKRNGTHFGLLLPTGAVVAHDTEELLLNALRIANDVDNFSDTLEDAQDFQENFENTITNNVDLTPTEATNFINDLKTITSITDFETLLTTYGITTDISDLTALYNEATSILGQAQRDIQPILDTLKDMQAKSTSLQVGFATSMVIPNKWLSISPYTRIYADSFVYADIADGDLLTSENIENIINGGTHTFTSKAALAGIMVTEFGIGFSREQALPFGTLYYGVTPKAQFINSVNYVISVDHFDVDMDSLLTRQTIDDCKFNLDIGLAYTMDFWTKSDFTLGIVGKNLIPQTVTSKVMNGSYIEYALEPLVTASASFNSGFFTLGLDVDLTETPRFTKITGFNTTINPDSDDYQLVSLGAELNLFDWVQFRAGYQHDLLGNLSDQVSAGFGFSPFGVVHIDAAAAYSRDGQYGASIQLAFTI